MPENPPAVLGTLEKHRSAILAESALVTVLAGLLVWLIDRSWRVIADPAIHLALTILLILGVSIILLGLGILVAKLTARRRSRRRQVLRPRFVELLTEIARGGAQPSELRSAFRRSPDLTEDLVADALSIQKGPGVLRIAEAAQVCGIPELWRRRAKDRRPGVRCTALTRLGLLPDPDCEDVFRAGMQDPEELVAIEAARSLIRTRRMEAIEALLAGLPGRSRLLRALLCEWLRPHSAALAARAIPALFETGDSAQILATLEAMASWRRALLIPALKPLLAHEVPAVRAAAWRVAPYALGLEVSAEDIAAALASPDSEVRIATLQTVGRLKMASCSSAVSQAIFDSDGEVSRVACFTAAALGMRPLLETTAAGGSVAAAGATEALEKSLIGRLEI
jgi:uncharacterized protein YjeT (DUF2065 family)